MKLLRELKQLPDNQLYLCNCTETAQKHNLTVPFECGCVWWRGGGVVRISLRSKSEKPLFPGYDFTETELVRLSTLTPVKDKVFLKGEND